MEFPDLPDFFRGPKKHINFSNINFLAPTQNTPFWATRKKFMCLISWERTQKRDPHKLFRGDFGGQKGSPKRAIFGHKKFSLLFFSCPYFWEKVKRGVSKPEGFPLFSGNVRIVSRTLLGVFFNKIGRPRKRKRTSREKPRKNGKITENLGSPKTAKLNGNKTTKKEGQVVQTGNPPVYLP